MLIGLAFLVVLILVAVVVGLVVRAGRAARPSSPSAGAAATTRRVVTLLLLAALVVLAAIGVTGLLDQVLTTRTSTGTADNATLARSLAFALIAGPAALLLWWSAWRRLSEPDEQGTSSWTVYLLVMTTAALVVGSSAVFDEVASLANGHWQPGALALALTWGAVWAWHRWMLTRPAQQALRSDGVADLVGATYGLLVGVGASIVTLTGVLWIGLDGVLGRAGSSWGSAVTEPLTVAVTAAAIWWLHWGWWGAERTHGRLRELVLLVLGVALAAGLALGGLGTALFVGLRAVFDRAEPMATVLDPLPVALAAAVVGLLLRWFHRRYDVQRSAGFAEAARLVLAGLGLAGWASGLGIVVNSVLDAASPGSSGPGGLTLLLAGISALAVAGPLWWRAWQPSRRPLAQPSPGNARQVYVVVVFGLASVVALITALVIANRIFEEVLGVGGSTGLLDRIRAPLGLLVATGAVAGYHLALWRGARSIARTHPAPVTTSVVLVCAAPGREQADAVHRATGGPVTLWTRADGAGTTEKDRVAEAVAAAVAATQPGRLLVVCRPDGAVDVIELAG